MTTTCNLSSKIFSLFFWTLLISSIRGGKSCGLERDQLYSPERNSSQPVIWLVQLLSLIISLAKYSYFGKFSGKVGLLQLLRRTFLKVFTSCKENFKNCKCCSVARESETTVLPFHEFRTLHGYGSTDLRLYTSTKLKMVNYWFYSLKHKKNNI